MKRSLMVMGLVVLGLGLLLGNFDTGFTQSQREAPIEERIANQQSRIDQGVRAKTITPEDAKILQESLNKIKEAYNQAKADGKVTPDETRTLSTLLDENRKLIASKTKPPETAAAPSATKPSTTAPPPAAPAPAPPAARPTTPAPPPAAPAKPAVAVPPKVVAASPDPKIQEEIEDQQKRIDQGVKSKTLTLEEAKTLEANLKAIKDEDVAARADGTLSQAEKKNLQGLLDQNAKMIRDKKTNPVRDMTPDIELKSRVRSITERIARQQARIDRGIKSGHLTKQESDLLQSNLDYIKTEEQRLREGGKLTDDEKELLHELLDQNGEMIRDKKHNPIKAIKKR